MVPVNGGKTNNSGTRHEAPHSILVVEDDAAIRDSLADALRTQGYQVEMAVNGLEALEKLRWGLRPCLIMLDLQMRVMTGWEFRAEQKKDPVFAKIPVVAMTAGRWKESDLRDFSARIEKPIRFAQLQDLLRSHCDISTSAGPPNVEG